MKKTLLYIIICFLFLEGTAQKVNYTLKIVKQDSSQTTPLKKTYQKFFSDTTILKNELSKLLSEFHHKGYLSASFDSILSDSLDITAYLFTGKRFYWKSINFSPNIDESFLRRSKIKNKLFEHKIINPDKISRYKEKLLNEYENNGYPFASIKLHNTEFDSTGAQSELTVTKNDLYTIDSIYIKGDAKISPHYIKTHIGINNNDLYNEEKIKNISLRIRELPFLEEIKPFEINFKEKNADIYLYLKNKKANQFNGILGFLPNNKTTGKLLLTGEVNLFLQNSFGKGEIINFDWQKLETESQELNIKASYPYLFFKTIGIDGRFSLLKKDTTYLTTNPYISLNFILERNDYVKVFFESRNSSLISTSHLQNLSTLPQYADVKTILYGAGYNINKLDYIHNPKKGYSAYLDIAFGQKTVLKNSNIPEDLYKDLDSKTMQNEINFKGSFYIPIHENFVVKIQNTTGHINNSSLFQNELFKLGGLKTIRGFDEKSIFASTYTIFTGELRFILEQSSSLYAFWDGAYYEKDIINEFITDYPFGFGVGLDFETKAGIFTINYALGKQFDNPIEIRSAKIHFGYINRF